MSGTQEQDYHVMAQAHTAASSWAFHEEKKGQDIWVKYFQTWAQSFYSTFTFYWVVKYKRDIKYFYV